MYSVAREFNDEIDSLGGCEPMIEKVILHAHERRISRLEEEVGVISQTVTKIEADVSQGNRLTTELCRDTREIREMVAGAKTIGRVIAWGVGLGVGLTSIMVALYALGWIAK